MQRKESPGFSRGEDVNGTLELVIPYPGNFQLGDILEVTVTNKGLE